MLDQQNNINIYNVIVKNTQRVKSSKISCTLFFVSDLGVSWLLVQLPRSMWTISLAKNYVSTCPTLLNSAKAPVQVNCPVLSFWTTCTMLDLWEKSSMASWVSNTKSGKWFLFKDSKTSSLLNPLGIWDKREKNMSFYL